MTDEKKIVVIETARCFFGEDCVVDAMRMQKEARVRGFTLTRITIDGPWLIDEHAPPVLFDNPYTVVQPITRRDSVVLEGGKVRVRPILGSSIFLYFHVTGIVIEETDEESLTRAIAS